ncbi:MAG: hypothetical protein AAF648_04945 [Pseudomonadota bacterium]
MFERTLRALFWGVLLFVSYNAFAAPHRTAAPQVSDIVLHAGAFATLSGLLFASYPHMIYVPGCVALLLYGGGIELVQLGLPERTADWKDFAVDALGIGLGLLGFHLLGRTVLERLGLGSETR